MRQRSPVRMVQVLKRHALSPNLLRLTLGGDELSGFPEISATASIKLLLPHAGQDWQSYLLSLSGNGQKPLKRTYTVLAYRTTSNELDVAFALHPNPGPATAWAQQVRVGDSIAIAGPGRVHQINLEADWFLLAGDMSAQAAVCANLARLPENAQGYVLLQINQSDDKRDIERPINLKLQWVTRADTDVDPHPLAHAIRTLSWLPGTASVWIAGESDFARMMRTYLINEKLIAQHHRHTSGYWQTGYSEDTHQAIKRSEPRD